MPEEVGDALPQALEQDWRSKVPVSICRPAREIFDDSLSSLFGDQRAERLEALREILPESHTSSQSFMEGMNDAVGAASALKEPNASLYANTPAAGPSLVISPSRILECRKLEAR